MSFCVGFWGPITSSKCVWTPRVNCITVQRSSVTAAVMSTNQTPKWIWENVGAVPNYLFGKAEPSPWTTDQASGDTVSSHDMTSKIIIIIIFHILSACVNSIVVLLFHLVRIRTPISVYMVWSAMIHFKTAIDPFQNCQTRWAQKPVISMYLWTPKPWKMKVLSPQNLGYNPKN